MENSWDEFESLGQRFVAAGRVIDEGGGGGEEVAAEQFEAEGQNEAISNSMVSESRDEGLCAAYRQGLVALDELTDSEKLMVLKDQHTHLKAAITPTAAPSRTRISTPAARMLHGATVFCSNGEYFV